MSSTSLRGYAREFDRDAMELESMFSSGSIEGSSDALVPSSTAMEGVPISSVKRYPSLTFDGLRLLALQFVRAEPPKNGLEPSRRVTGRCTLELLLCIVFELGSFSGR